MKEKCLFLMILLAMSTIAHAQVACPPGMIPYGTAQDMAACGPDPSVQQSQDPPQTQASWESRWGAIATDGVKGILGTATGEADQSEAEKKALAQCRAKGGSECKIQTSYANGCAAMIVGNNGFSTATGSTIEESISKGTKICRSDGDTSCHVYYTDCSLPSLAH